MEAFSRENTRNRITLISVAVTLIYLVFHQPVLAEFFFSLSFGRLIVPILVAVVLSVGFLWVIGKVDEEMFLTLVQFPAVNLFIVALFLELQYPNQVELPDIINSIYYGLLVFVVSQMSMLTANVLFVSYQKNIPLGQAGRATSYVLSLVVQYLAFFILFSSGIDIFFRFVVGFTIVVYYTYFLLWTLRIDYLQTLYSTFIISSIVFLFGFILSVWTLSAEIIALVLSVILYVLIGVALEQKDFMSKYVWIEYGVLIAICIGIVMLFAEWGINGTIF